MRKVRHLPPNNRQTLWVVLGILALAAVVIEALIPLLVPLGVIGGVYYLATQNKRKQKKLAQTQILFIEDRLNHSKQEYQQLGLLLDRKEYDSFKTSAQQLIKQLQSYSYTIYSFQRFISEQDFTRLTVTIQGQIQTIKRQLEGLQETTSPKQQTTQPPQEKKEEPPKPLSEAETVAELAPEILQTYTNIQKDHITILEKIKEADNHSELTVLHEINMKRFRDILSGYLLIKQSPKDYYNASERLAHAKAALEQFDLDLDETLRQLNESSMKDFEISLRMMNIATPTHEEPPTPPASDEQN